MSAPFSLRQLGWRPFFSQQLTLDDLATHRPARVVGVHRGQVDVLAEAGGYEATLPGPLTVQPAAGDWALIEQATSRIVRVLERQSLLERIAAGAATQRQAIAANVDALLIVTSCNHDFNESRLERYLVLAREARIEPVVVLTKVDQTDDVDGYVERARALAADAQIIALDARASDVAEVLRPWCAFGRTIALVGSSGVGKSTLVNSLLDTHQQATGGVRENDSKGRHTTSARQMFALPSGAWIIDTPGMRELRLTALDTGASEVFDDIDRLAAQCRFRDCRHSGEPGCGVAGAIARGELDNRRLANYLKLQREAANAARSLHERRERERRFGRIHRDAQRVQRQKKGQDD